MDLREQLESAVESVVAEIVDPCSTSAGCSMTIKELGLLKGVVVEDGAVVVDLRLTAPSCPMVPYFVDSIERSVAGFPEIDRVVLNTDGGMDWSPADVDPAAAARRTELLLRRREEFA